MYDLAIVNGTVVTPMHAEALDVGVRGETIASIERSGRLEGSAQTVVDASGCLVIPGGVDPHVHYSLGFGPVSSESQDWSPAAAFGGTTTVIDFALQEAPASLHEAVQNKKDEAAGRMAVDYGLHAILSGPEISFEVLEEIGDVVSAGIPTIKTFTTYGWMVDDGYRWGIMNEVAQHGGMNVIHAEDDAIAGWLTKKYRREGKTHGAYISETRGPLVEEAAIRRAMLLAERAGAALYVLHMAAGSGVMALAEGRARGLPLYGETLTHYLAFTSQDLWDDDKQGLLWNNYPVLKHQEDQDVLWEALADDRLQAVGSDHFSISVADRYDRMGATVDQLQAGQAGVELRLPVLFHLGVRRGRLSLNRFVEVACSNPAKLMGLFPRKGTITPGSDADIVIIDPGKTWTVDHRDLHMSSDFSCFDGWELEGRVRTTILRGQLLVDDGDYVGPRGDGRFLERRLPSSLLHEPLDGRFTLESAAPAKGDAPVVGGP